MGMRGKRRLFECGFLVCAGALPLAASAAEGWYLGVEGGANLLQPQDYHIYGYNGIYGVSDGTVISNVQFDTGWAAGFNAGYAFQNGFRPEFEFDYRLNQARQIYREPVSIISGSQASNVGGDNSVYTGMFNLWYDFFRGGRVHPYIGGGVGEARVAVNNGHYDSTQLNNAFSTVFAYQAGGGIGFDLGKHWGASLDYRNLETNASNDSLIENQPSTHIQFHYRANTIMAGLHYSFGVDHPPAPPPPEPPTEVVPTPEPPAPPPPPPPPPPPCEQTNLSGCKTGDTLVLHGVNFDFNKASLTLNAKSLLDQVGDALVARKDIKVEVDGHTDGKGSGPYNMKLSQRRADSVKQYLIGRGVDAGRMTTRGYGKTMPIADNSTDEGREQNRRVELKVTDSAPDAGAAPVAAPADAPAPAPAEAPPQ